MNLIDREDFEYYREIGCNALVIVYDEDHQVFYYIKVAEDEKEKSNKEFYLFVCGNTVFSPEHVNVRRYWVDKEFTKQLQSKNS